jgi:hypothetical protein
MGSYQATYRNHEKSQDNYRDKDLPKKFPEDFHRGSHDVTGI